MIRIVRPYFGHLHGHWQYEHHLQHTVCESASGLQALTQLAGIAYSGQRCSCTALSIICAMIQRHLPSDSWMPFLQEVQITYLAQHHGNLRSPHCRVPSLMDADANEPWPPDALLQLSCVACLIARFARTGECHLPRAAADPAESSQSSGASTSGLGTAARKERQAEGAIACDEVPGREPPGLHPAAHPCSELIPKLLHGPKVLA